MSRLRRSLLLVGLVLASQAWLRASDPPHAVECKTCHTAHSAPGVTLTIVPGNANLCMSCHLSGGTAGTKPFVANDQGLPGPGLPAGTLPSGTSHRWDSGPAGHLVKGTPNTSTGALALSGAYTGAYPTTIQIKISTAGQAGAARFDWQQTVNGSSAMGTATTGVLAATTPVALGTTGISVAFANGAGTPSFILNDVFLLFAQNETRAPVTAALSVRMPGGQFMCSTCHDQHSQANKPFDKNASATYTPGVTNNRHFQRTANDTDQMCVDCHAPRNQTAKGGTTHPITLPIPATSDYKAPTSAVLDSASNVQCQSCHKVHYAPTSDGTLLRVSNAANLLCDDCHTYKTAATKGIHFDATLGVIWPGGQYGSSTTTYPALASADRGNCDNCHATHGWPDARNTSQHYAKMLVDEPSNLCLTCHDGTPQGAAPNVQAEITKTVHHPVERASGRTVSCGDCHNPHKALKGSHTYATTATSTRNQVSNVLKGVDGVVPAWGGLWAVPASYATTASATYEYQICFKCHTNYDSYGATRPGGITTYYSTGTAKFTSGGATVAGTGTAWAATMVGMYVQKNAASPAYRITAATAASLTITPVYAGPTDATAAAYAITREQTNLAVEFNPANASGHPVAAGLNSYGAASVAPKALTTAQMKAPWTAVGTQTMMCTDCHNTNAASPAAQGPHGSATQFMLRGPLTLWPPTGTFNGATLYNTTFCANCHTYTTNNKAHAEHEGRSVTCYNCHILVPHGGKLGRLIGDGNSANFPARYAYQNNKSNMFVTGFKKASPGNYSESNCGATCDSSRHSLTNGVQW